MKELSIEEKAKAYDEAIAHAKMLLKTIGNATLGNLVLKNEFKNMFPELKESEDEKIRKSLIKGFKRYFSESVFNGILVKDILAWLEKQCEKGINGKNREIPFSEQKPNPCGNCGIATNNCQNFPCVIRDGEQKPAEKFPKYKKGDILTDGKNKYEVLSWDYTETGIAAYYMKGAGFKFSCNCEEVDKKLYIVEQKPQRMVSAEAKEAMYDKPAWSEEDEYNVKLLLGTIKQDTNLHKDRIASLSNWLKSIKGRCLPQPKQEWGEIERKLIEDIIYGLRWLEEIDDTKDMLSDEINFLKNLRPQKQWKPSDEQIEILDMVLTNESMDDNVARILRELREQLKKLREG